MYPSDRMLEQFGKPIYDVCRMVEGSLEMTITGSDAIHSEDQDQVNLYQVFTTHPLEDVRRAVALAFCDDSCGCQHDCCGHWFRSSVKTVSAFDREGVAYFIVETFSRNF